MTGQKTLVESLRRRAEDSFASRGYTFPGIGPSGADVKLTYAELHRRARSISGRLLRAGAQDSRALLIFETTPECLAAFFGCLGAGVTVVPVPSPSPMKPLQGLAYLERVAQSAGTRFLIGPSFTMSRLDLLLSTTPALARLERIDIGAPYASDSFPERAIREDAIALIQYTSGSTSEPRGVTLDHRNLFENARFIRQAFDLGESECGVSWLPPHHDMGLMGGILEPLFLGCEAVLLPPSDFVRRPSSFLEAITRFRGTCCGGPSFAYDLMTRRVLESARANLDLSSWRVAFCGSEPVRVSALEGFARTFASSGFRRASFLSCYGLAEATLLVSATRPNTFPVSRAIEAREVVSCGRTPEGVRAVIVDPKTRIPSAQGVVGEIWVQGANVASGYWADEPATNEVFGASLVEGLVEGEEGYLRTGDLGFISEGELHVTGRLKDLIIIRGRNLLPHDIEQTVETSHEAVRAGRVAAFSIERDSSDRLVLLCEISERHRNRATSVESAIRAAVAANHDVVPERVILLGASELPRTTSGKPRRSLCKQRFLEGAWPELAAVSS